MADTSVTLAAITGAHGVAGEVRLKLLGEGIDALKSHASFQAGDEGAVLTLSKIRSDNKGGAIARFAEIGDRTAAEKLRGTALTVPRTELPALEEGEYYHADLIGLTVVTDAGETVGRSIAVHNFGATDIIEIAFDPVPEKGQKTFMVPMTAQAVPEWDDERILVTSDFVDR